MEKPTGCGCLVQFDLGGLWLDSSACEVQSLRTQLREYAGWSPHQFTGLMKEHRELQQRYKELDAKRVAQLEEKERELERLREVLYDLDLRIEQALTPPERKEQG